MQLSSLTINDYDFLKFIVEPSLNIKQHADCLNNLQPLVGFLQELQNRALYSVFKYNNINDDVTIIQTLTRFV